VIFPHLLAAQSHKRLQQTFSGFYMVLFSSFSIFYMFPLGTIPSSDVLKLDLQPQNEPLFSHCLCVSCTSSCYPVTISLSDHEASAFLQQSLLILQFRTHHVLNFITLKFFLDAFHTLSEMKSF
jgi:hypothetical protein